MKSAHFSADAARARGEPGLTLSPLTVDCRYAPEVVSQKWENRITIDYEHDPWRFALRHRTLQCHLDVRRER